MRYHMNSVHDSFTEPQKGVIYFKIWLEIASRAFLVVQIIFLMGYT